MEVETTSLTSLPLCLAVVGIWTREPVIETFKINQFQINEFCLIEGAEFTCDGFYCYIFPYFEHFNYQFFLWFTSFVNTSFCLYYFRLININLKRIRWINQKTMKESLKLIFWKMLYFGWWHFSVTVCCCSLFLVFYMV